MLSRHFFSLLAFLWGLSISLPPGQSQTPTIPPPYQINRDSHTPSHPALSIIELEANARSLEPRSRNSKAYDDALEALYNGYLREGDFLKATDTAQKLWQYRDTALGPSDDMTIDALAKFVRSLPSGTNQQAKAESVLEQALTHLSRLPKRQASAELSVLELMMSLARDTIRELTLFERITSLFERDGQAFAAHVLVKHRSDIHALASKIPSNDTALRQRAHAVSKRAWLAHEATALARWQADQRSAEPPSENPSPGQVLADLFSGNDLRPRFNEGRPPAPDAAQPGDDAVEPKIRAVKALEILPRIVDYEWENRARRRKAFRLFPVDTGAALKDPLWAIVWATAVIGPTPDTQRHLTTARQLLLAYYREESKTQNRSSGQPPYAERFDPAYLRALDRILEATKVVDPAATADLTRERDTVSRGLQIQEQLSNAILHPNADNSSLKKLNAAVDQAAANLDPPDLVAILADASRAHPDHAIEIMNRLNETLGNRSRVALEFTTHVLGALAAARREYEALLLGKHILPTAETQLGLQDRVTQALIAKMLPPALKFESPPYQQDLVAKSAHSTVALDDALIQSLLQNGFGQAALRTVELKLSAAPLFSESGPFYESSLNPLNYELIAVLGKEPNLSSFADLTERGITSMLNAKPDPAEWLFPPTEAGQRFLNAMRPVLLRYPQILRGDCQTGPTTARDLARAREQWFNDKARGGKVDRAYLILLVFQMQTERASMDCFLRAGHTSDAVRVVTSSTLWSSITRDLGKRAPTVSMMDFRSALLLAANGKWAGAEAMLKRYLAGEQRTTIAPRNKVQTNADDQPQAQNTLFDTLAAVQQAPGLSAPQLKATAYLKALWRTKGIAVGREDLDLAFQLAQHMELSTASAIARMSARAAGGPELDNQVRTLQDLEQEAAVLRARSGLFATPDLLARLASNAEQRNAIEAEIAAQYPGYYDLISPHALSLSDVQRLLTADEALLLTFDTPEVLSASEETFIIAITKTHVRWARSPLGTHALTREVAALRCGLDEEEWATDTKVRRCANLLQLANTPDPARPLPFHLGRAHRLFTSLFGGLEPLIAGKRLLIVPSGPLTSLPFATLVTRPPRIPLPDTFEQYHGVSWLGAANALVTLPAVSSLAALREQKVSPAPEQYAGYGNPVLDGDPKYCSPVRTPAACPTTRADTVGPASTQTRATVRGRRARRSANASIDDIYVTAAGPAAAPDKVRALCPLPDTEYEINCVGAHFNPSSRILRLQADATERDIKSRSENGQLSRYRILHFATHGLLSGDVQQITNRYAEPALVLTPPQQPAGVDDDGLLTASEVTGLKLNADFVILSACNTAAGEKIGAEALSGLARAFFYAGTRSLLVSHWPLYSDAAVQLSTLSFAELDRAPQTGRAEALQRAMVVLMNDRSQPSNAHPAVWAPFVLVGESKR